MKTVKDQLIAKAASLLTKLRPTPELSEWANSASGQDDADALENIFRDSGFKRNTLLDYWDSYICLVHFSATLDPYGEADDFAAFLVGVAASGMDVKSETHASKSVDIGLRIASGDPAALREFERALSLG